jgi:soluble lytic murein transglycosylase
LINFSRHRITLIIVGFVLALGAILAPFAFMSASCSTRQQQPSPSEARAIDQLRAMTRGGVLPSEDVVARLESQYPNTQLAGLARLVRARIRIKAGDFGGAASLLEADVIRERTSLGDYALHLRADALEKAGRTTEARADFEKLLRNYPSSRRAREAALRAAQLLVQSGQAAAAPVYLSKLNDSSDAAALLLTAKAYEQASDSTRAFAAYRRLYFYAPASTESVEAASSLNRLGSTTAPATAEEALARADRLFEAKRYNDAAEAYADAFGRFSQTATAEAQLRRGIALSNQKRAAEAATALNSIPSSAGETRAQALFYLAQTYAISRQWEMTRATLDQMRQAFPQSVWTRRAYSSAGQLARDAKNTADAAYFFRSAVNFFPGTAEVAQAQFELAWQAHESKNFAESARLLTEHLANYADKNTDNRGRAGYWAARDSERAGLLAEARALYQAMQGRYDANWYGYLAKQRLDTMIKSGNAPLAKFAGDSTVARAIANLQTVTVAEETAGPAENQYIAKAEQLTAIGMDGWALEELAQAAESAPDSPRVNLAMARIYRLQDDNVRALNTLKRSFPDYSQMKPEEMTREEWDVFYPLAYWDIIVQEARARRLDPYQVAGLIRQESVFNPRARSTANAFGLMQLLVPTGRLTAQRYGVERTITEESLYEPRLNIQLGTAYFRDQLDKYGRIEYVAAAYNAGPGRLVQWRQTLPLQIDEWAEAIPFRETRLYVQGVVRNTMQYQRLYDENGQFRPEVGARAISSPPTNRAGAPAAVQPANSIVRPRRTTSNEED